MHREVLRPRNLCAGLKRDCGKALWFTTYVSTVTHRTSIRGPLTIGERVGVNCSVARVPFIVLPLDDLWWMVASEGYCRTENVPAIKDVDFGEGYLVWGEGKTGLLRSAARSLKGALRAQIEAARERWKKDRRRRGGRLPAGGACGQM